MTIYEAAAILLGGCAFGALVVCEVVFEEIGAREWLNFRHELRIDRAKKFLKDEEPYEN